MSNIPACPQCTLENTYPDGPNYVCADCGYEWPMAEAGAADTEAEALVKDANGNVLQKTAYAAPIPPGRSRAPR